MGWGKAARRRSALADRPEKDGSQCAMCLRQLRALGPVATPAAQNGGRMKTNQATLFDDLPQPARPAAVTLPPSRPQFICHEEHGTVINQRRSDGYIDASAMCRAHGKLFADFLRLDWVGEVLQELE